MTKQQKSRVVSDGLSYSFSQKLEEQKEELILKRYRFKGHNTT